ncbi:MAG: phage protease [Zoogloeaceae bacterium]|jgi:phage I-like protein|nr:phage protease [Zoogloeaceae bacterium]
MTTELIASLAIRLDAADLPEGMNAHLFPDGEFAAGDGRPAALTGGRLQVWKMGAAIAARLVKALDAEKPILYDYEHDSATGKGSRAAGWIDRLAHVAGRGLFAHVEWTPGAAEAIARKEYRFSSPYFAFDAKTGAVTRLISVALTNVPALADLSAVGLHLHQPVKETPMDAEQLAALTLERDTLKTQCAALTAERDALKTAVAALEAEKTKADEAAAQTAAAALEAEKEALLAGSAEKLTPPLKESLKTLSLDALKIALAALPASPLTKGQTDGKTGAKTATLTDDEAAMCARMGVTQKIF